MCQAIREVHSCGCDGACVRQKCPAENSPACEEKLQHPSLRKLVRPCDKHKTHSSTETAKRRLMPPSAYFNSKRNPLQSSRPEITKETPARHSTLRKYSKQRRSSNSRKNSESSEERSENTPPRSKAGAVSAEPVRNTPPKSKARPKPPFRSLSEDDADDYDIAVQAAADRVRRSLELRRQEEEEEQDQAERHEMFLEKDRRSVAAYEQKRAERKSGLRPGRGELFRQKTDGICRIM